MTFCTRHEAIQIQQYPACPSAHDMKIIQHNRAGIRVGFLGDHEGILKQNMEGFHMDIIFARYLNPKTI